MAREIRETPILFGEDARRFLARMQERHVVYGIMNFLKRPMNAAWLISVPVKRLMEVLIRGSNMCSQS